MSPVLKGQVNQRGTDQMKLEWVESGVPHSFTPGDPKGCQIWMGNAVAASKNVAHCQLQGWQIVMP